MCIIYLFSVHKRIEDFDKIGILSAINQKKCEPFKSGDKSPNQTSLFVNPKSSPDF